MADEHLVQGDERVVCAGTVVTSQGPGTALEFSLALVAQLCGQARRDELAAAMVVADSVSPA